MGPEIIVVGIFAAAVVAGIVSAVVAQARSARRDDTAAVIVELGLRRVDIVRENEETVLAKGSIDGVAVELRPGSAIACIDVPVEIHGTPAPPGATIGDPTFDAVAYVQGPDDVVLAKLHRRCREAIQVLLAEKNGYIESGLVRQLTPHTREELLESFRRVVAIAKALEERPVGAASLLRNIREDTSPHYRVRCFHELLRAHASSPELVEAARIIGPASERLRPVARVLTAGAEAVAETSPETIAGAIHALPPPSRGAILRRLAALGPTAEPVLLALLAIAEGPMRLEDPPGARDAATLAEILRAFGGGGTIASVERLMAHASGLLTSSVVKEAAQEAITLIQGRAKAGAGALALSDSGTEGAVSMTADPGRVSLAGGKKP